MSEKGSERTCVGGGGTKPVGELERFVYDPRVGLIFDARQKAPGRGAWVSPSEECLKKALDHGFARAFRLKPDLPTLEEIVDQMVVGIRNRMIDHLRVTHRSRRGFVGGIAVEQGMRENKVDLLLIASDAGVSNAKKFRTNADRKGLETIELFDGAFLGSASGREFVSVMGIQGAMATKVSMDVRSLRGLNVFEG